MTEGLQNTSEQSSDGKILIPRSMIKFQFDNLLLYWPDMGVFKKNDNWFIWGLDKMPNGSIIERFVDVNFLSEWDAKLALLMLQWICIILDGNMRLNALLDRSPNANHNPNTVVDKAISGPKKESFDALQHKYPNLVTIFFDFISKLPRG